MSEYKNTFWACKDHTHNNTLRCAICDEQRITKLEARLETVHLLPNKWLAALKGLEGYGSLEAAIRCIGLDLEAALNGEQS